MAYWSGTNGNDNYNAPGTNDLLYGLDGDDILNSGGGNDTVYGGIGNDEIGGGNGNDRLYGEGDNDTLLGGTGNDDLYGGPGNDFLDGGADGDVASGGSGNDTYVIDSIFDRTVEFQGQGIDTVQSYLSSYTILDYIDNLVLTGAGALDGKGNTLDNVISGNDNNNKLEGMDGDDTLYGYGGNDQLLGGNDEDKLYGLADNDYLDGGADADEMVGGTGNDIYTVDNAGDTVTEYYNQGIDTVRSYLNSYFLGNHVENLLLLGSAVTGIGNDSDNSIGGNGQSNLLMGGYGDDWFNGLDGNDQIYGGEGSDIVYGGNGNDLMYGGGTTSGEFDELTGGGNSDTFVLGSAQYDVHYLGTGYATIMDFNHLAGDEVLLSGFLGDYTLSKGANHKGGAALDTVIMKGGDWIGVIADTTDFSLVRDANFINMAVGGVTT